MADLSELQKKLGVRFKNTSLLELALTHSSYVNEKPELAPASNERLEFLGDSVLGLVVAEKLYREYPNLDEGEMTRLRAALVRLGTLAGIAGTIGLGDYLYLGKGEEVSGGRRKPANLAAALEAVIAAVFLDRGLAGATDFALGLLGTVMEKIITDGKDFDYKSELQHIIQSRGQETPSYEVISAAGPEHSKTFTVEVKLGNVALGRGSGKSKKAAEIEAARVALEKLPNGFTR